MDSGIDMREVSHSASPCSSRVEVYSTDSGSASGAESTESSGSSNERRSDSTSNTQTSGQSTSRNAPTGINALKLFIGQIPRFMNEADIRPMFEEFGPISDILVLRDKLTGIHKDECYDKAAYHQP
ncbi:unnamed protein product [Rodentolepis nana]|uniref:RRM domain-containing protein n=1 Tax=Rodentolepis nana TaxID=102285 RepID=A0A0R3TD28_RODNA|nr:unnamed protein product [Rodentolepis nana]